jgi:hypothetical protein
LDRFAAVFTQQRGSLLIGRGFPIEFIPDSVAMLTLDERFTFFDTGYRNEKNLKIMIDASVISLVYTAHRTTPGILVYNLCFWGYADYKKHWERYVRSFLVCK